MIATTRYRINRRGRIVVIVVPLVAVALAYLVASSAVTLQVTGVETAATYGDADTVPLSIETSGFVRDISTTLDGVITEADLRFGDLTEGEHTLVVRAQRFPPWSARSDTRSFTIDRTPPEIVIESPSGLIEFGDELTVAGTAAGAVTVEIDGEAVDVSATGEFELDYAKAPRGAVTVVATDGVGNSAEVSVPLVLRLPGAPGEEPMRGVHATGYTWVTESLRDPIVSMLDEGLINTIQLDLKDESGKVWYDTGVTLAHEIGAVESLFDLEEVVDDLHARGVRVVGRIVNFRDPILAEHAASTGQLDWLVLNPDGTPFQQYGGFTNPFSSHVREYNIALAEEAAALGVDDILFDYVRRPDAPVGSMLFPDQDGTPEDAIVSFLDESARRVGANGGRIGASVFGIAATRPLEIAQDIPRMSEHVAYVAPMVYPSHWGRGEYDVIDPDRQPYDIVYRSLLDFRLATENTDATVVAWLQDFSLGSTYGAEEVRAQIEAALDAGVTEFILWDPAATYTADALRPSAGE